MYRYNIKHKEFPYGVDEVYLNSIFRQYMIDQQFKVCFTSTYNIFVMIMHLIHNELLPNSVITDAFQVADAIPSFDEYKDSVR